jgi:pimeloyl-ACP methyl ester carboxylesterase
MIGKILGRELVRLRNFGAALGEAVQGEVSERLQQTDSAVLQGLGKRLLTGAESAPTLPRGLRRMLYGGGDRQAILKALPSSLEGITSSRELRARLPKNLPVEQVARQHPNFFPSLLASLRSHPPLSSGNRGKPKIDLGQIKASQVEFRGKTALVSTRLSELIPANARRQQLLEDYAVNDIGIKLTIPLEQEGVEQLSWVNQRQLLQSALQKTQSTTGFVHGFQSTKEIWDSTSSKWRAEDSLGVALDGFGSDGQALSDASAPYTPKQYAFQVLETLDVLGLLGNKPLTVVGHSMGGAATGEMAVALDKAGYRGKANFVLLAPACSSDHMPIFQAHRSLVDVANALLIGGIYVPLGAWEMTAPVVQWADESFPIMSKMMVDHGWGLKDCPKHIREHNAGYYRSPSAEVNQSRRDRSMEAMLGLALQEGLKPQELSQAAQRFGVFVANFGLDRLVDPAAVRRLQGPGIGYLEVGPGSHNAAFSARQASRLAQAAQSHFEKSPSDR